MSDRRSVLPGASGRGRRNRALADWPITYDELEPYYSKVEWAFGVSGEGGANKFEGPRSREYPCPPLPLSHWQHLSSTFDKFIRVGPAGVFPTVNRTRAGDPVEVEKAQVEILSARPERIRR